MLQFVSVHGDLSPEQRLAEVEGVPAQISRIVQAESAKVHGVGHDQWKATRRGRRGGLRTGRFHEGKNLCRSVRTGGKKVQGHAQSVDRSTSVPISLEQAFFAASGGGDSVPAHSARLQAHANGSALGASSVVDFRTVVQRRTDCNLSSSWNSDRSSEKL